MNQDIKDLEREISDLQAAIAMIESPIFQQFIALPIKKNRDSLRTAFFSDSLKESWRKGGKQEGINECMKLIELIPQDLKNKRFELEQLNS